MPVLVHDKIESAVRSRFLHGRLHGRQEQVGAHDRHQLSVLIDRHGAHNADIAGKCVDLHIGKDQFSCFHRLDIPGAETGVEAHRFAALAEFGRGTVIYHKESPFRQRYEARVRLHRGGEQGDHHVRHVGGDADAVRQGRVARFSVSARSGRFPAGARCFAAVACFVSTRSDHRIIDIYSVRQDELCSDLAVQGRVRRGKNIRYDIALVVKKLLRVVSHHPHAGLQVAEHLVHDRRFHLRVAVHRLLHDRIHHLADKTGDGFLLLLAALRAQVFQHFVLVNETAHENNGSKEHRRKDQVKDLILDSAYHKIPHFFHVFSPLYAFYVSRRHTGSVSVTLVTMPALRALTRA